jgi:hypothetical protein
MPDPPNHGPARSDDVQTAVVRSCEICGGEVQGARKDTCSDRCRAERWRRQRDQVREDRDAEVRALLNQAVKLLKESR